MTTAVVQHIRPCNCVEVSGSNLGPTVTGMPLMPLELLLKHRSQGSPLPRCRRERGLDAVHRRVDGPQGEGPGAGDCTCRWRARIQGAAPGRSPVQIEMVGPVVGDLLPVGTAVGRTRPARRRNSMGRSSPARRDRGFSRAAWSFGGRPCRSQVRRTASGPRGGPVRCRRTSQRRPVGPVCDPCCPFGRPDREQVNGPDNRPQPRPSP